MNLAKGREHGRLICSRTGLDDELIYRKGEEMLYRCELEHTFLVGYLIELAKGEEHYILRKRD